MSDISGERDLFVEANERSLVAILDTADELFDEAIGMSSVEPLYQGWWQEGRWQMPSDTPEWLRASSQALVMNSLKAVRERLARPEINGRNLHEASAFGFWCFDGALPGGHEVACIYARVGEAEATAVDISGVVINTVDERVIDGTMVLRADDTLVAKAERDPVRSGLVERLNYMSGHNRVLAETCLEAITGDPSAMAQATTMLVPRLGHPAYDDLYKQVQTRFQAVVAAHGTYDNEQPRPNNLRRLQSVLRQIMFPLELKP